MRSGGMLCRSQAATAVCVPGDARSMVVGRRADRTIAEDARLVHDVRYVRLGAGGGCDGASVTRVLSRRAAVPSPPPMPRRRGAPVAVTLPMVTKSPKETPARETAAAKRTPAAPLTATVAPADQVLQVVVMKVAIHCEGCAGKVRKHISKMEVCCRGDIVQHRSGEQKGHREGSRVPSWRPAEHLQGQEGRAAQLNLIIIIPSHECCREK
ncbi:unnamed protein product [Alopecurus aequalis]